MWKTVLRRVLIMIPEIIILSVFVFILAKMMPGDPFTGAITPQTSPARIHELKVQAGLYDPWYVQYGRWITNLFHGDLGISYQFKTPVDQQNRFLKIRNIHILVRFFVQCLRLTAKTMIFT